MITVAKRELKARMPAYFRLVEQNGEELTVTDRGPSSRSRPLRKRSLSITPSVTCVRRSSTQARKRFWHP